MLMLHDTNAPLLCFVLFHTFLNYYLKFPEFHTLFNLNLNYLKLLCCRVLFLACVGKGSLTIESTVSKEL